MKNLKEWLLEDYHAHKIIYESSKNRLTKRIAEDNMHKRIKQLNQQRLKLQIR